MSVAALENLKHRSNVAWLDGLRAIAVGLVVAYHIPDVGGALRFLHGGFVGVDVFFVLSGFLVTRSLVAKYEAGGNFRSVFWLARARRIAPALIVVLSTSALLAFLLLRPSELQSFSQSAVAALFYVSNFYFYAGDPYEANTNALIPLIHTWSLSAEAQFYLLYPFLVAGTLSEPHRLLRRLLWLTGVSYVLCHVLFLWNASAAFYWTPSRFWEFGAGALAATSLRVFRIRASLLLPLIGLAAITGAAISFDDKQYNPALGGLLPVTGTVLVLLFTTKGPVASLLSLKPLMLVGAMSYSVYLWHQPILAMARLRTGGSLDLSAVVAAVIIILALSFASWRLVEVPFYRRKFFSSTQRIASFIGVAQVALIALAIVGATYPGTAALWLGGNFSYEPRRGLATRNGKPCPTDTTQDVCVIGDQAVIPSIALLGDSHAATISGAAGQMFKTHSQSALLMPMRGCPFIVGVRRFTYPRDCATHADQVFDRLLADKIQTVVISDYRSLYLTGTGGDGVQKVEENAVYSLAAGRQSLSRASDVL